MASYLLNIVLQIIESLVCFYFYENITTYKKSGIKRLSKIMILYVIMYAINIIFNYNVVINTLVMVISHILISFYLYKQKMKFSVIYSCLITSLVTITEISAINLVSVIFNTDSKAFIENTLNYIIVIVFSKSMLFIALKIISDIIRKYNQNEKIHFIFLLYPLSLLIVLTSFVVISYNYDLSNKIKLLLSASIVTLTFSVLLTCVFQQLSSKKEKEFFELKAVQQRQELDTTYFELLEHQNEELQLFVHDTKNHLSNVYNLSDNPQKAKEYIKNLVTDIDHSNQLGKSSNKLLDLIINKYSFLCNKKEITFEKNIHKSDLNFIPDSDLTSIFNNLLDNAVEAAENSNAKLISLNINNFGNLVHIDLNNSCDIPPSVKNGHLLTSKSNDKTHGFGFKSVARTVKKYKGDIEWEYKSDEKTFLVSIIFPINK